MQELCLKSRNRTWIRSVQGAIATWSVMSMRYFLTILSPRFDRVAIAPCTDPTQDGLLDF